MDALLSTDEENEGIDADASDNAPASGGAPASEAEGGAPSETDKAGIPQPERVTKNADRQQRNSGDREWLARLLRELPRLGSDGFYGSGL